MSTDAQVVDGARFAEGMASVRLDSNSTKYILVGHENGNPNSIDVVGTGDDLEGMINLLEDDQVMYALARYESTYDMSNTVKFVYFHWIGDGVPYVKRGRYGVVHGCIEKLFHPYHLSVETGSRDDFSTELIMTKLEENTGKVSKVRETSTITDRMQERGFTQTQLPKRGPVAKTGPGMSKEGAKIDISDETLLYISEVRSDDCPIRWMLAEYKENNAKNPLEPRSKGEGSIDEMKDQFEDSMVMYGLYRVTDTVDDITTVKFVFIQWVGEKVKPMMKAKISTHKGTVEETMGPFHTSIFANCLSDVSEEIIMDKVTFASGSKSHVK